MSYDEDWEKTDSRKCPKCDSDVEVCSWDSSCDGYMDYHYRCTNPECKYDWWIDGIDSWNRFLKRSEI